MIDHLSKVEDNLGLVISQAKGYAPTRITDIDDYIQVGCIALIYAIKKYDKSKGNWSTYAGKAIHRAIIRERSRFIEGFNKLQDIKYTPPDNFLELLPETLSCEEINIIRLRLENKTMEEIASETGYTKQWISKMMQSIYQKIREGNEKKKNITS